MSEDDIFLDLESLTKVTSRLAEALEALDKNPDNLFILDSVVKRFELTYELSIRNLRRFLLDNAISAPEIEDKSFQGIIRTGARERLIQAGWPVWKDFKDARNQTVHSYHEPKARLVAESAKLFLPQAEFLLKALRERSIPRG